jgi:Nucleotidyl transferase AbiEii toxin, Type IV TA system
MGTDATKIITGWHLETLPPDTLRALTFLSEQEWLRKSQWYLAGGTALSLQTGNRLSVDLDFFTEENEFDNNELFQQFAGTPHDWETGVDRKNTVYGSLFGAKISFIAYPFFVPDATPLQYGTIRVLDKRDIAVMKITAISQRGRKRDFFDLFWCANNIESLETIITRLKKQYPSVAHEYHHILKALVYFGDAESDPDPVVKFDATWADVKTFFENQVPAIALRLMK